MTLGSLSEQIFCLGSDRKFWQTNFFISALSQRGRKRACVCMFVREWEQAQLVTSSPFKQPSPFLPFSVLHSQAECQQFSSCCGPWLSGSSVAGWQDQWCSFSGEASLRSLHSLAQHCATSGTVFDPRSPEKPSWAVCCAFSTCTRRWRTELSFSFWLAGLGRSVSVWRHVKHLFGLDHSLFF